MQYLVLRCIYMYIPMYVYACASDYHMHVCGKVQYSNRKRSTQVGMYMYNYNTKSKSTCITTLVT